MGIFKWSLHIKGLAPCFSFSLGHSACLETRTPHPGREEDVWSPWPWESCWVCVLSSWRWMNESISYIKSIPCMKWGRIMSWRLWSSMQLCWLMGLWVQMDTPARDLEWGGYHLGSGISGPPLYPEASLVHFALCWGSGPRGWFQLTEISLGHTSMACAHRSQDTLFCVYMWLIGGNCQSCQHQATKFGEMPCLTLQLVHCCSNPIYREQKEWEI